MKTWLLASLFLLQGCTANYFLYSPNDEIHYRSTDFTHQVNDIFVRAKSGNTLHFQHHQSQAQQGLVVHFHGNRGNLSQTVEKVLWLVDDGYDLLLVDYSGYGKSSGTATRENLRQDAETVFEYASNLNAEHKVIVATSMGGAIALDGLSASGLAAEFDLLVIDSSFESYQNLARDVVANVPIANWFSNKIPSLVSDERAPFENIQAVTNIPILITHCEDDTLIPIERSEALLKHAPGDVDFWRFTGCQHARTFTDEFPQNQAKLLAFINENKQLMAARKARGWVAMQGRAK